MSILDDEEDLIQNDKDVLLKAAEEWYINHSEPASIYNNDVKSDYAFTSYFDQYQNHEKLEMITTVKLKYRDHKVHINPVCDRYPVYLIDVDKIPEYIIIDTDYILKVKKDGTFDGDFEKFYRQKISRL